MQMIDENTNLVVTIRFIVRVKFHGVKFHRQEFHGLSFCEEFPQNNYFQVNPGHTLP